MPEFFVFSVLEDLRSSNGIAIVLKQSIKLEKWIKILKTKTTTLALVHLFSPSRCFFREFFCNSTSGVCLSMDFFCNSTGSYHNQVQQCHKLWKGKTQAVPWILVSNGRRNGSIQWWNFIMMDGNLGGITVAK